MESRRPPAITEGQRAAALEAAQRVRRERAAAAARIKSGELPVGAAVATARLDGEGVVGGMRLYRFCRACPGVGGATARAVLRTLGLGEDRRLRSLGWRQAEDLASMLGEVGRDRRLTAEVERKYSKRRHGR